MVKHYATSKKFGTGCPQMRSPNPYGKGTLQVPTIEEFAVILQKKNVKIMFRPTQKNLY